MTNQFLRRLLHRSIISLSGLSLSAAACTSAALLLPAQPEFKAVAALVGGLSGCLAIAGSKQIHERRNISFQQLADQFNLASNVQTAAIATCIFSAAITPNQNEYPYRQLDFWFKGSAFVLALCNAQSVKGFLQSNPLGDEEFDFGIKQSYNYVLGQQQALALPQGQSYPITVGAKVSEASAAMPQEVLHNLETSQPLPDFAPHFAPQKGADASLNVIEQLAATHLSIVTSAPPGTGKTCTGLAWLANVFQKYPKAIVLIAAWKNDPFLGLNRLRSPDASEPGAVVVLDGMNFKPLLFQLNRALKIMEQRKNTPKSDRAFEDQPVWVILDDYYATIQTLISNKNHREIWNEIKSKMAIIATVGREFFVGFHAFTHSLVLTSLGLSDSNVRHCLNVCALGKISHNESGRVDGGYDAIYSVLKNPNIIGDAQVKEQLTGQLISLQEQSEATGKPIFFTTMGHPPTLTLLGDFRWTETYQLPDEIIDSLAQRTGFVVQGAGRQPLSKTSDNCIHQYFNPESKVSFTDSRLLPTHPGVYCVTDSRDTPLYVGEAGDIRMRWNPHYPKYAHHWLPAIHALIEQGEQIFIYSKVCDNREEMEAIIEAKLKPAWNGRSVQEVVQELSLNAPERSAFNPPEPLNPLVNEAFSSLNDWAFVEAFSPITPELRGRIISFKRMDISIQETIESTFCYEGRPVTKGGGRGYIKARQVYDQIIQEAGL